MRREGQGKGKRGRGRKEEDCFRKVQLFIKVLFSFKLENLAFYFFIFILYHHKIIFIKKIFEKFFKFRFNFKFT